MTERVWKDLASEGIISQVRDGSRWFSIYEEGGYKDSQKKKLEGKLIFA
jgi:hypothetical protein